MKQLTAIKREYPSGFKAKVICKPHFKQKFMGIIVDFGGADPQLVAGGAHFLEHKLYAKKAGDISHQFEALNATTNAFTSYNKTMFYVSFIDHWRKVLPLLFELVGTTHFTKENINKESEIIGQELAMYQDDPNWKVNHSLMQMMFPSSHLAEDLTGTAESIQKMTPQILKSIYQEHYLASKMQFVACGGFTDNQARSILTEVGKLQKQFLSNAKPKVEEIQVVSPQAQKEVELSGDVGIPHFSVGLRLPDFKKFALTNNQIQVLIEMMLEARFGPTTAWFEENQRIGLLNSPLSINVSYTREGNFATINGVSKDPVALLDKIKMEFEFGQADENLFNLQKKSFLARTIREFDDIETTAIEAAEMSLENDSIQALLQYLQTLSFTEFSVFFSKVMAESEIFTAILNQQKDK